VKRFGIDAIRHGTGLNLGGVGPHGDRGWYAEKWGAVSAGHQCRPLTVCCLPDGLWLETLCEIAPGEQMTIDHAWPADATIPSQCGTASCRGWIVSEEGSMSWCLLSSAPWWPTDPARGPSQDANTAPPPSDFRPRPKLAVLGNAPIAFHHLREHIAVRLPAALRSKTWSSRRGLPGALPLGSRAAPITIRRVRALVDRLPRYISARKCRTIAQDTGWDARCFAV
jgi:hypothetical protein